MINTEIICTILEQDAEDPKVFDFSRSFTMKSLTGKTKEQRELLDDIAEKGYAVCGFSNVSDEHAEMRNVYAVMRTSEMDEAEAVTKAIAEITMLHILGGDR